MTTEQMDWYDDQINKGVFPPHARPEAASSTCDWGNCGRLTECWRWSAELKHWLPVCIIHADNYRPWWKPKRWKRGEKSRG